MVDPSSYLGGRCFVGGSSNAARHLFDVTNLWLAAATLGIEADATTDSATTACCRGRRRWSWGKPMVWLLRKVAVNILRADLTLADDGKTMDQLELSISISCHGV